MTIYQCCLCKRIKRAHDWVKYAWPLKWLTDILRIKISHGYCPDCELDKNNFKDYFEAQEKRWKNYKAQLTFE